LVTLILGAHRSLGTPTMFQDSMENMWFLNDYLNIVIYTMKMKINELFLCYQLMNNENTVKINIQIHAKSSLHVLSEGSIIKFSQRIRLVGLPFDDEILIILSF